MTEPITPDDLRWTIPDEVIKIFNQLIKENWDGRQSIIRQDIVAKKVADDIGICIVTVFDRNYLDIEDIYTKAGWEVTYQSPAYNDEPYEPFFIFRK